MSMALQFVAIASDVFTTYMSMLTCLCSIIWVGITVIHCLHNLLCGLLEAK